MALEKMSIMIEPQLRDSFLEEVKKNFGGKVEEGIYELMRVYVEKSRGQPPQAEIRKGIKKTVFEGDKGGGLAGIEIEKILLNKTDKDILDNML